MASFADTYIANHKEARHYLSAHPYVQPAYTYLEDKWNEWNKQQDHLPRSESEQKLTELFDGLTNYFLETPATQEELVEISTMAARKVLVAESLLAALDQNSAVKDEGTLGQTINDTLQILIPRTSETPLYKKIPDGLLAAVKATQVADTGKDKGKASTDLRNQLEEWVRSDFPLVPFAHYTQSIGGFREFRAKLTEEVDRYQTDLLKLEGNLKSAAHAHDSKHPGDTHLLINQLLATVGNRVSEIEDFRNGLTSHLPPQPEMLSHCVITSDTIKEKIDPAFLKNGSVDHVRLVIKDLPALYNNIKDPAHPLVNNTVTLRQRMDMITSQATNPAYHKASADVFINESGMKSWKRTIDKLADLNFDWDRIRDINRVNVVFYNAESMFFYNQVLRDTATSHNWDIGSGHDKSRRNRDRGITMQSTGCMNWHVNMEKKCADGRKHNCEVKLDNLLQYQAEVVHHKIYECARLLQDENTHTLRPEKISPERYEFFCTQTQQIVTALLSHKEILPKELEQPLQHISILLQHTSDPHFAPKIYTLLEEAHLATCAIAAKHSSPSMAALYDIKFKEMAAKDPHSKAEKMRIYNKLGPREAGEAQLGAGQFGQHDTQKCRDLISKWEQSWKGQSQQRAV